LRVLDCKSQNCQDLLKAGPVLRDCLCEACDRHYAQVLALLKRFGVDFHEQPRLVRGLDYYTRTAFEVTAPSLGAQDAVAGGGRYNGLTRELGGPDLPGLGFAIGEDRLMEVLPPEAKDAGKDLIFLATLGPTAKEFAFGLIQKIRNNGIAAEMDFDDRSLKAQMSLADRLGATFVVILGEKELTAGEAIVRRMADFVVHEGEQVIIGEIKMRPGEQRQISLNEREFIGFLANQIGRLEGN
jgi:histidyl-tRNA synthetase